MKQKQIVEYRPKYPKRLLKSAILTTAAAVALAGTTGCDAVRTGGMPEPAPTDELVLDGEIAIDPGWDDPEATPEPDPESEGSGRERPELIGIIIADNTPEP